MAGMTLWFTADTHFGHASIIEYANRPWATAEEMDEALVERWNSCVQPNEDVWHLGDFAVGLKVDQIEEVLRRLNGRIHMVLGNHDERGLGKNASGFVNKGLLASVDYGIADLKHHRQHVVMSHYAMTVWNRSHFGAWMLHGHSHGSLNPEPTLLRMDVGVDGAPYGWLPLAEENPLSAERYRPVSFDEVAEHMAHKAFQPVDHHGRH
jgi:calcineurin-like phosphoesterase family protein